MKIISVVNRKGGAGKSTVVFGIVSAAVECGLRVAVVDTDKNGTTRKWSDRANVLAGRQLVEIAALNSADAIYDYVDLIEARGDIDLLILDNGGAAMDVMEAASAADLILVPMQLSGPDLEQTINTVEWFDDLRTRLEDPMDAPKLRVLLNNVPASLSKTQAAVLLVARENEFTGDLGNPVKLPLMDFTMKGTDAYRRMAVDGPLGVILHNHNSDPATLPMQRNPKYMVDSLAEMSGLLDLCLTIIEEA